MRTPEEYTNQNIRADGSSSCSDRLFLDINDTVSRLEKQAENEILTRKVKLEDFTNSLGYDYDRKTKTTKVNEEEAETVRYIFERYVQGAGAKTICKELEAKGIRRKRGSYTWHETGVLGILKNERYIGGGSDVIHHDPIVSEEVWNRAQEIMDARSYSMDSEEIRRRFKGRYPFSSKLQCAYCGAMYSRRIKRLKKGERITFWECITLIKKTRADCPDSVDIYETALEQAFIQSMKTIAENTEFNMAEFIGKAKKSLSCDDLKKDEENLRKASDKDKKRISDLADMKSNKKISPELYDEKYAEATEDIAIKKKEIDICEKKASIRRDYVKRLKEFGKAFERGRKKTEFDADIFDALIEKVIIGGFDPDGAKNPYKLEFVYRTIPFRITDDAQKYMRSSCN